MMIIYSNDVQLKTLKFPKGKEANFLGLNFLSKTLISSELHK